MRYAVLIGRAEGKASILSEGAPRECRDAMKQLKAEDGGGFEELYVCEKAQALRFAPVSKAEKKKRGKAE